MTAQTALAPFLASPDPAHIPQSQKIIALCGDSKSLHALILQSLCIRAARGERLALVIGNNHFDAYRLARLVRAHGCDPAALLAHIELSRPFTCHQLQHRVASFHAQANSACDALYVLGLLEMFYDEDVKPSIATRRLIETLTHLQSVARNGMPILISITLPKLPGREHFVEIVRRAADAYWEPAPVLLTRANARQLTFLIEYDGSPTTGY